jgi:hypothetical protein
MPDLRWTLLAAGFLAGCSQLGGGTELPSPIQVYIFAAADTTSTPVSARQTRIWSVDSQTTDSVHLTSRGLLADSSGILQLPPDSGTFLLESWIHRDGPESLSLHATVPARTFPDTSCLQTLGRGGSLQKLRSCADTLQNPSAEPGTARPELVAFVRVSGGATHPFRMLRGGDTTTLQLSEIRLWSLSVGDSLVFGGVLRTGGGTIGQLSTLMESEKFVVQGWSKTGAAPERIQVRRASTLPDSVWSGIHACANNLAAFGSKVTTLYSCTEGDPPMPADSATFWSAVDFVP